jgi:DNA gyrase subunit B/topoisomerase-4 subunit B
MNFPRLHRKLDDCQVHGPGSGAELFVVEGDSASLAVSQVRQPRFQAVLPMQGKPLNAIRASAGKVAANPFFAALTAALGTGHGAAFKAGELRYDRIVLLFDPDADGIHCGVLLLMFFYRWMRPLLDLGQVHAVRAPVGELVRAGAATPQFIYSELQFHALCAELLERRDPAARALRYRGLAGLNPEFLATLCVNPATRTAQTVSAADAELAIGVFGSARDLPPQQPLF